MSRIWIICDVYENDLSQVRLGEFADVRLNGYPDLVLKARIGNIAAHSRSFHSYLQGEA